MKTKGLTRQELSAFCAGVSVLLGSGSGMEEAVGLYAEDSTGALEAACKAMVPNMSLGFGEAAAQTGLFPDYALAVMQTAEASGRLEEGLGRLAEYYDRQDALEKKVRSAVTYPAALLLLLGGVLAVLVFGVMPMFQNVYDNVTGGLAASSYAYVLWAEVLSRVGLCVAILASVGLLVLAAVQRRDPEKLRPRFARFPLTKDAFLTMAKANMTDMLATQLCSGMDGGSWNSFGISALIPQSSRMWRPTSGLYRTMSSAPREWTVRCRMAMRRHRRQPCSVIWTALAL